MLAETHLIRVQTHMEDAQPSEIALGGYVHLPNRTKMKRHYMKKLGTIPDMQYALHLLVVFIGCV